MGTDKTRDGKNDDQPVHGDAGGAFKREGPTPATEDTGRTVDEMNRAAEESLIRNTTPDQQTD